jgi:hypothetical protein
MEDKSTSFYEFLAANSKLTKEDSKKIHPFYLAISWIIIFLGNSAVLWLGWNYALSPVLNLSSVTYLQSILMYSFAKVITRGFFTVQ